MSIMSSIVGIPLLIASCYFLVRSFILTYRNADRSFFDRFKQVAFYLILFSISGFFAVGMIYSSVEKALIYTPLFIGLSCLVIANLVSLVFSISLLTRLNRKR